MARDMVCLFKFLATMESELLRRRSPLQEWPRWQLTFEQVSLFCISPPFKFSPAVLL